MRRVSISLLFCFVVCASVFAQEYPPAEVFGGYSYLHMDTQGVSGSSVDQLCNLFSSGACPPGTFQVHPGFNGWQAAGEFNLSQWLGVKADLSGYYGQPITGSAQSLPPLFRFPTPHESSYNFLFGPVLSYRKPRYTPFAHALFGVNHVGFGQLQLAPVGLFPGINFSLGSENHFALALGGGVDIKMSRHFLLRAGEFDYLLVKDSGGHQNNFRVSTGLVFAFGGK